MSGTDTWVPIPVQKLISNTQFKISDERKAPVYHVMTVDTFACKHHVHINDSACYDNGTTVYVKMHQYDS